MLPEWVTFIAIGKTLRFHKLQTNRFTSNLMTDVAHTDGGNSYDEWRCYVFLSLLLETNWVPKLFASFVQHDRYSAVDSLRWMTIERDRIEEILLYFVYHIFVKYTRYSDLCLCFTRIEWMSVRIPLKLYFFSPAELILCKFHCVHWFNWRCNTHVLYNQFIV